jgi:transcriptional antiterminator RfaH
MSHEQTFDNICWYLIHTNPKQEDRASKNLQAWGVEVFAPQIKERHFNEYTGAVSYTIKPLFPRYIFARFRINDLFHKVRFTRGVHSIVSFGDVPTPVDDRIINIVSTRIGGDGFVKLTEDLKPGDEVTVIQGPFRSLTAMFEREIKGSDRVVILLNAVKYQARVELSKGFVKKLGLALLVFLFNLSFACTYAGPSGGHC